MRPEPDSITTDDESALARRAQAGDLAAFAALVARHQEMVRACLAARMSDLHEAEDLSQEVFLIAYGKLGQFEPHRSMGAWLRGIAMNLLRNHRRKLRPIASGGHDDLQLLVERELMEEDDAGAGHRMLDALRLCLGKLDLESSNLLRWRYRDELSMAQLAARLRLKHSTVTMKLHRLRGALRDCIEGRLAKESA